MTQEPLIAIVGPTAVGKTALGIELAKTFGAEIISGDSMQVYRTMDIGTAKATVEEMAGIPHHLIDILEPGDTWTVSLFQEKALLAIASIRSRGKWPLLVGGTGLYVQALTHELSFGAASSDPSFREEMELYANRFGNAALHEKLAIADPKAAEAIHANNVRRVIRALEVIHLTGKPFSEQENGLARPRFDNVLIGLEMERQALYERINRRVDAMMEAGLLEEVHRLYQRGIQGQAIQAIGYKELYAYFDGKCTCDEAIEALKTNSRRYAKRQLTWFKNRSDAVWFNLEEPEAKAKIFDYVHAFLAGKGFA
ncbi:tRNA (adenosine(37)-N6)-dimethylallyltransferase MiaA [Shouchella clausii]|nr:tRNA (adenosine(37)-N6)-dimethylallyltransferase MiaA [Shouchella clausii]PAD93777.1 tRNA (adenosine(37)-N6)-dimethylallyltransferase MiaA [Shouchella clausii]